MSVARGGGTGGGPTNQGGPSAPAFHECYHYKDTIFKKLKLGLTFDLKISAILK